MSKYDEAIEWFEDRISSNQGCIELEDDSDIIACCTKENEEFDLALSALRDAAERAKGCEYCNEGYDLERGKSIEPSLYIEGNELVALRYDEADSRAEIRCCPKCGRELTKEANDGEAD